MNPIVATIFHALRLTCFVGGLCLLAAAGLSAHDNESLNSSEMEASILGIENNGNVKKFTLEIENKNISSSLNYFVVGVPCGKVADVIHSKNWPAQIEIMDKATGFYGIRFSNSRGQQLKPAQKMTVSFSISYLGDYCTNLMETWHPKIAYNFGSFILKDTLNADQKDIPEHIDFNALRSDVKGENLEVKTYTNPEDSETTIDFVTHKDDQIKVEVFNLSGLKISTMFIGYVNEGIHNLIKFNSRIFPEKKYIFRLRSSCSELYGKLIFP